MNIQLMEHGAPSSRHIKRKLIAASVIFALTTNGLSAYAQMTTPVLTGDAKADSATKQRDDGGSQLPVNGYAQTLKPKVKRLAVIQNQPYQPIRKVDDEAQIPEIEMFVGESRVFPTPGVARIAVGNGQILTAAALDNKETILFANAVGTSSLFVWNEDGRYQRVKINIVPGDTTRFAREIAAFLTTIPNAKASIIGDKVIVEGDNLSDADLAKIDSLAKHYPQIVNFTDRVGWEKMVMMDVKVVEFPINELREIGLKWSAVGGGVIAGIWQPFRYGNQGGLQANIQSSSGSTPPITNADGTTTGIPLPSSPNLLSAFNIGLNAQLNMLAQDGKAAILAEPQLAARSGSDASFMAGGEFPYSVATVNGVTVQFKPYGIKLDIHPRVDRNGMIRAKIESEVSKIDSSVSSPTGPALLTRKTNTEFNVRSGETMVLSGLIQVDNSTDIDKVPLLGDIPILGALFRSKRFQNKETELVVFVTPTIVDSKTPGLVERVERTKEKLQQHLGKQPPFLSEPLQPQLDPADANQTSSKVKPLSADEVASGVNTQTAMTAVVPVSPSAMRPTESVAVVPPTQNPFQTTLGGSTLKVNLDGLVMRAEPNAQSTALMQLGKGSVVKMTGVDPWPSGVGIWRNIVVGEIQGWVESRWVEPSKLQPNARVYNSATANTDRQGAVIGLGNPQSKVQPGYTQPASAVSLDKTSSSGKRYRVNLQGLALRVTPDVNAPVIEKLPSGAVVEGLSQPPRGYWSAVQTNGKRGWVATQWIGAEE